MPVRRAAMSRRLVNVVAAATTITCFAGVAVIGCTSSTTTTRPSAGLEKKDLTVAAVPAEGATGLYIAQQEGLFAKVGLHVTIKSVTSILTVIPDLKSGAIDVASGQYPAYIAADANAGIKMRILAAGFALTPHVNEIMAGSKSSVKSLADLKGKTIAVNAINSEVSDLLYTLLASYGVSQAQVKVVAIPFPAMAAALAAHTVSAAYMTEPYATEAGQNHGDVGIEDVDTGPNTGFPVAGYAALASWAHKYPHTAAAFAKAIDQGNRIADTDIAELQRAFMTALHLPASVADNMATGTFPTAVDYRQIQRDEALMLRYHQLTRPFNVKTMIGS
jgi:NitT/TauT family transport system substrate-binding protein